MTRPSRRARWAIAADLLAVAILVSTMVTATVQETPPTPQAAAPGDDALYRVFSAERTADGFRPVSNATLFHLQVAEAGSQLAIRYWGSAAGNGSLTLWQAASGPVGWETVAQADDVRHERRLFGPTIVPHCLLVREGTCGVQTAGRPVEWLVDAAWSDGSPHGVATGEILRRWDEKPFPRLLAVENPEGWLVFERASFRAVAPFAVGPVVIPADVPMQDATEWLFNDRDPAPRIGLSLSEAWERAGLVAEWNDWWKAHPEAKVVGVVAPRDTVLEDSYTIAWTVVLQDGRDSWEATIVDDSVVRGLPAMLDPLADYVEDPSPDTPPDIMFRSVEARPAASPARMPDLGSASHGWSSLSDVSKDVGYVFYEHALAGERALSFVGGWSVHPEGTRFRHILSGVLYDGEGHTVGYSARLEDGTPGPVVGDQGTASAMVVQDKSSVAPVFWWSGIAVGTWLLRIPAGLLFSKVRAGLLDNETRRRIVEVVVQEPGKSVVEVARLLGAPHARIQYHLRFLRVGQLVDVEVAGGRTLLFPWKMKDEERRQLRPSASPRMNSILDALRTSPGITVAELSGRLGVGETLVARYLRKGLQDGVVKCSAGRPARWHTVGGH